METLALSRSSIAYVCCGQGKPLVLLHGYPLDHRIWDGLVPLLEHDFQLIIPDLRGFGQSKPIQDRCSISEMADDIAELIGHLDLSKVLIAGHSMGGYVSLAFARAYPDQLLGLGLIASQAIADSPDKKESRYLAVKQLEEFGVEIIAKNMAGKLTSSLLLQKKLYEMMISQPEAGIKNAIQALAGRPDQTSLLGSLGIPVLVVHGDSDELIPVEQAWEVSKAAPKSNLVIIPKTGHMPMLEFPDETASALRWLK
jgi:3-oxoadipate enol-lactonase